MCTVRSFLRSRHNTVSNYIQLGPNSMSDLTIKIILVGDSGKSTGIRLNEDNFCPSPLAMIISTMWVCLMLQVLGRALY